MHEVRGYDGVAYGVGDRVELHPATDLWMRGARYGVVVGIVPTPDDRVRVLLDATGAKVCGSEDTFRKVGAGAEVTPTNPDNATERIALGTLIADLAGADYVTTEEAAAVVAWCREWVADAFADPTDEPGADDGSRLTDEVLLRGCERHIDGGLAFVLADVRRCAVATSRPDLAPFVESTRYALTWDDVAVRESQGRPYDVATDVVTTPTTFGTVSRGPNDTTIRGTGEELRDWARRGDCSWPCSELARLDGIRVGFDARGDLVDITGDDGVDVPSDELNAWTSEVLVRAGYPNHPAIRGAVTPQEAMSGDAGEPCDCGTVLGASGRYVTHGVGDHPDCTGADAPAHWHVATGLAGYGPDGAEGFATFDSLADALDYARDELSTFVDMAHETAANYALGASQYLAAWKLDHSRADMLQLAAEDYADAWNEHERAEGLVLLRANLDPSRASAPLYVDDAAAYAELQARQASEFPHDVSANTRLYLWQCEERDCEHYAEHAER